MDKNSKVCEWSHLSIFDNFTAVCLSSECGSLADLVLLRMRFAITNQSLVEQSLDICRSFGRPVSLFRLSVFLLNFEFVRDARSEPAISPHDPDFWIFVKGNDINHLGEHPTKSLSLGIKYIYYIRCSYDIQFLVLDKFWCSKHKLISVTGYAILRIY